jgi:glycosyltransferase involved in cell wall biosynthesis
MADAARVFSALKKITGFEMPNSLVIVNPVTVTVQQSPVAWPSLNQNANYCWVMMAQLDTDRKAQDVLIKALSTDKWKQRNWELFLYGKGADNALLEELIETNDLKDKIHLMGHTKEVEKVLANAHLLLQITHIDAMPLSVTEAMNMSRPCVVSKTGDMPLWIDDAVNGFIAGAVTEKGIDAVLEKAWMQKDDWQQMGVKAFDVFQQKYPRPYEAFYENIFSGLM